MLSFLNRFMHTQSVSIQPARDAVARALVAHRDLRRTIRETNGSTPKLAAALADQKGLKRPEPRFCNVAHC